MLIARTAAEAGFISQSPVFKVLSAVIAEAGGQTGMKLYTYYRSQASFRVRIAMNLKGLTHEDTYLHLEKGDQFDPAYNSPLTKSGLVDSLWIRGADRDFRDGDGARGRLARGSNRDLGGDTALAGACVLRSASGSVDRGRV